MSQTEWQDVLLMAATIWGESRGEAYEGKIAVGKVIKNRADRPRWWGKSIREVCQKPYQFSCWNANDPNYVVCQKIREGKMMDDDMVQECISAALNVLIGNIEPKFSHDADHYHTKTISPAWRDESKFLGAIGNHVFYKLEN